MFRTFYSRILMLVVGLVLTAQLATFGAVLRTIDSDVKSSTRAEIEKGSILVGRQIDKRLALLLNSAEVLAADYGFKSAIASNDHQTIRSLVLSHWTERSKFQHIMSTRSLRSPTLM